MVATTGAKLLPPDALRTLRTSLLPQSTVLTPNLPEARLILADAGYDHMKVNNVGDLEAMAKTLQGLGPEWVLVKGGHCPFRLDGAVATTEAEKEIVVDVLFGHGEAFRVQTEYQKSRNTHGTGCSLACTSSMPTFFPNPPIRPKMRCQLTDNGFYFPAQLPLHRTWQRAWMCLRQ
jgi:hydroxymethylpyrimidine kinase/phosphomethylpyrimidine kinase